MIISSLALARYTERHTQGAGMTAADMAEDGQGSPVDAADDGQWGSADAAGNGQWGPADVADDGQGSPADAADDGQWGSADAAGNSQDGSTGTSESPLDLFLDAHFPDERMERIYPNAKLVE